MSTKLDKIVTDIEKTKERINTARDRLKNLENQRDELEKVELVHTLRTLKLKPADLKGFIDTMKNQINVHVPEEGAAIQQETSQNPEIIYREVEDEE